MEENQELVYKLSLMQHQIQQFQQKLQTVEQNIIDLSSLSLGLDGLINGNNKEVLAQIGGGIFAKTKLLSEDLIVNIGGGNLLKKSIPDTKKLIEEQIEKLDAVRQELSENLNNLGSEFEKMIKDVQEGEKKAN
jgi:prefoldin alpha subunit